MISQKTVTVEEGAFTITSTVGGGGGNSDEVNVTESEAEKSSSTSGKSSNGPTPRFGASMAVAKSGQLFLFGGMVEDGDKQITLNDFYSLGETMILIPPTDFLSRGRREPMRQCARSLGIL